MLNNNEDVRGNGGTALPILTSILNDHEYSVPDLRLS